MSATPVIYGISNCDTVKKARNWLQSNGIEFEFHDFRKQGIEPQSIQRWIDQVGGAVLLNKRGTTWRKLPEQSQQLAETDQLATLLADNPTLIKRPVLQLDGRVNVGFSETQYSELFG